MNYAALPLFRSPNVVNVVVVTQDSKQRRGQRERNDRLIALPIEAPRYASVRSVNDLSVRAKKEIESFFVASAAFEKKNVLFGQWAGVKAAYEQLNAALAKTRP